MRITHLNPEKLHKNPAFSQAIMVEGAQNMLYIGGQNAIDQTGTIIGTDLATQTEQALKNVLTILEAAETKQENVVSLKIYVVHGQDLKAGFGVVQKVWGMHPTTITVLQVAELANPQFLIEIEAIAAL
jgi:2-iminobutanoate/2-iminopropanoate deaminase